ncbi:cation-transporting P-type ATPase [Kitasatospora purpeofusca]|uniref:cation-transporting P-type ATPase n=1 Tax=Kitasatospora purpeofusca TaxID=67352 RepID=UPI00224EA0CD|nr:cation-transporting P-type ATPase [Kitasatospora purpeofusca]MCX4759021.1 cation-transporting P-type ATPase [Kitasatospora purpeofusca]WSR30560.1 cation-transporting P-type ATPase [Kitasatospora purpeofusca]WSR38800.1 cation-transporting P-type ATPase [Kitasatospora purpeofusca]
MKSRHETWVRPPGLDPEEAAELLLRDLHSSRVGLTSVEAQRRLLQYGGNELRRRGGRRRMPRTGSTIEGGGPHPACGAGRLE